MSRTFKNTPHTILRNQKHANVKRVLGVKDLELAVYGILPQPHKTVDPYVLEKIPQGFKNEAVLKTKRANLKAKGML